MPRPKCPRRICGVPGVTYFKPAGVPLRMLEEVVMTLDEVEAIRLADLDGSYQEQAAEGMRISRPTFSRLIESAHGKIADALLNGKAIRMEGGAVIMEGGSEGRGRNGMGASGNSSGMGRGPCGCGQGRRAGHGRGGIGRGRIACSQPGSGEGPREMPDQGKDAE